MSSVANSYPQRTGLHCHALATSQAFPGKAIKGAIVCGIAMLAAKFIGASSAIIVGFAVVGVGLFLWGCARYLRHQRSLQVERAAVEAYAQQLETNPETLVAWVRRDPQGAAALPKTVWMRLVEAHPTILFHSPLEMRRDEDVCLKALQRSAESWPAVLCPPQTPQGESSPCFLRCKEITLRHLEALRQEGRTLPNRSWMHATFSPLASDAEVLGLCSRLTMPRNPSGIAMWTRFWSIQCGWLTPPEENEPPAHGVVLEACRLIRRGRPLSRNRVEEVLQSPMLSHGFMILGTEFYRAMQMSGSGVSIHIQRDSAEGPIASPSISEIMATAGIRALREVMAARTNLTLWNPKRSWRALEEALLENEALCEEAAQTLIELWHYTTEEDIATINALEWSPSHLIEEGAIPDCLLNHPIVLDVLARRVPHLLGLLPIQVPQDNGRAMELLFHARQHRRDLRDQGNQGEDVVDRGPPGCLWRFPSIVQEWALEDPSILNHLPRPFEHGLMIVSDIVARNSQLWSSLDAQYRYQPEVIRAALSSHRNSLQRDQYASIILIPSSRLPFTELEGVNEFLYFEQVLRQRIATWVRERAQVLVEEGVWSHARASAIHAHLPVYLSGNSTNIPPEAVTLETIGSLLEILNKAGLGTVFRQALQEDPLLERTAHDLLAHVSFISVFPVEERDEHGASGSGINRSADSSTQVGWTDEKVMIVLEQLGIAAPYCSTSVDL